MNSHSTSVSDISIGFLWIECNDLSDSFHLFKKENKTIETPAF